MKWRSEFGLHDNPTDSAPRIISADEAQPRSQLVAVGVNWGLSQLR